jgi:hypothetical protein
MDNLFEEMLKGIVNGLRMGMWIGKGFGFLGDLFGGRRQVYRQIHNEQTQANQPYQAKKSYAKEIK